MNNEKYNQIINEAYESYTRYPLATIHDHRTNILYQNMHKGWCMLNGRSMASPHPTRHLTKEEFIKKCKTDAEFSEKWGLKIEEREVLEQVDQTNPILKGSTALYPRKLITITYNNETIEVYE